MLELPLLVYTSPEGRLAHKLTRMFRLVCFALRNNISVAFPCFGDYQDIFENLHYPLLPIFYPNDLSHKQTSAENKFENVMQSFLEISTWEDSDIAIEAQALLKEIKAGNKWGWRSSTIRRKILAYFCITPYIAATSPESVFPLKKGRDGVVEIEYAKDFRIFLTTSSSYIFLDQITNDFPLKHDNLIFLYIDSLNIQPKPTNEENEIIRKYFSLRVSFRDEVNSRIAVLRSRYELLIGVHIRLTDFRQWQSGKHFIPVERYIEEMRALVQINAGTKLAFLIACDEELPDELFKEFSIIRSDGRPLHDFCTLSMCDFVIGSISGFSKIAAFLACKKFRNLEGVPIVTSMGQYIEPEFF